MNQRLLNIKTLALALLAGSAVPIARAQFSENNSANATSTTGDSRSWFGQVYTPLPPGNYGLLGQTYAGVDFSYIHQNSAVPSAEHKYSFISNLPVSPGFDFAVKYDYLTGGYRGQHDYENNVVAAGTAYLPLEWGKPFLSGEAGWAWAQKNSRKNDSFSWAGAAGVEFQLLPPVVLTPYIKYEDRAHLSEHAWDYGVKATYRFAQEWSATLGFQINEHKDTEYTLGVNRHF